MQFDDSKYNKEHLNNLYRKQIEVKNVIDNTTSDAIRLAFTYNLVSDTIDDVFSFDNNAIAKRKIDELIRWMHDNITDIIRVGDNLAWSLSNRKNDAMLDYILKNANVKITSDLVEQWYNHNKEAQQAFVDRVTAGMDLSDRVWNITDDFYNQIQYAIDLGIGEGKSASRMTADVRQLLKEPNNLFRRVRDKHGNLVASKAMKAHKAGRGVYHSSYKNALRLTATENNIAYRTSDYERWNNIPFVEGITIHLSNNHPVYDICDTLAGDYSKSFKFVGWHPHCRCFATAKLPDEDEFLAYLDAIENGTEDNSIFDKDKIDGIPDNFKQWYNENKEKVASAKKPPYFIKDNLPFIKSKL